MAARPTPDDVLKATVDAYAAAGGNVHKAAADVGISPSTFRSRLTAARRAGMLDGYENAPIAEATDQVSESGTWLVTLGTRIKTPDDLLADRQIDLNHWKVKEAFVNQWEQGAKLPDGRIAVTPLWQVKVRIEPRKADDPETLGKEILAQVSRIAKCRPIKYPKVPPAGRHMLEISIPDLHIGKLAWEPETGENYDSQIAQKVYWSVLDQLLSYVGHLKFDLILLPIGNDAVHIDSFESDTAKGTRVDSDSRWTKMLATTKTLFIHVVNRLLEIAPVEGIIIPGNHDPKSAFAIGEILDAYYRENPNVLINNVPRTRKYKRYGRTLLGFAHGDGEAKNALPGLMMREASKDFLETTYHAWHLGHEHVRKEVKYTAGDVHAGIDVDVIPSLSGTDAWHFKKGYVTGLKEAWAYTYHHELGLVGRHPARPPGGLYK